MFNILAHFIRLLKIHGADNGLPINPKLVIFHQDFLKYSFDFFLIPILFCHLHSFFSYNYCSVFFSICFFFLHHRCFIACKTASLNLQSFCSIWQCAFEHTLLIHKLRFNFLINVSSMVNCVFKLFSLVNPWSELSSLPCSCAIVCSRGVGF